jgi:hypothetical protein
MLRDRLELVVIVLAGAGFLFIALRWGFVGGGGGVSYREKSPINFWLGVAVNVIIVVGALAALTDSFVRPDQFHM